MPSPRGCLAFFAALGLPGFDYDFENVTQITNENDEVHGMSLHQIRPGPVTPSAEAPWRDLFPASFCQHVAREYADIQRLAGAAPPRLLRAVPKRG